MRIELSKIKEMPGGSCHATFTTRIGIGRGVWRGADLPVLGTSYDVEFTLTTPVELGRNADAPDGKACGIEAAGEDVYLMAMVEGSNGDGTVYLRLSPDCLILADCAGRDLVEDKVLRIRLCVNELGIYPFDL